MCQQEAVDHSREKARTAQSAPYCTSRRRQTGPRTSEALLLGERVEEGCSGWPCHSPPQSCPCVQPPGELESGNPHGYAVTLFSCSVVSDSLWPHEVKWSCSVVSDSTTAWTVAHQAPPSMGFSRQEYWSGSPFLLQISPTQGVNQGLPHCIGSRFTMWPCGLKQLCYVINTQYYMHIVLHTIVLSCLHNFYCRVLPQKMLERFWGNVTSDWRTTFWHMLLPLVCEWDFLNQNKSIRVQRSIF